MIGDSFVNLGERFLFPRPSIHNHPYASLVASCFLIPTVLATYDLIDEAPACESGNAYYCGPFCAAGSDNTTLSGTYAGGQNGIKWEERWQHVLVNGALPPASSTSLECCHLTDLSLDHSFF